jgi:hypothetical protein
VRLLIRSRKDAFTAVSPRRTYELNVIAQNAGNLVFSHAMQRALSAPGVEVTSNLMTARANEAAAINEQYDAFVVPLANAFRLSFQAHLDRMSELIERLTIPVVVTGVGAQGTIDYKVDKLAPIADSVKRFVSAVLDRSASIGVRGELTHDYLKGLGFSDVEVIGCPSLFMYGEALRVDKKVPLLDRESRIALNISPYRSRMAPITMANYQRYPQLVYLPQDLTSLGLMLDGADHEAPDAPEGMPVQHQHPLYRDDRMRFCIDPWVWTAYLAEREFSFGTRIHGNIAALLGGTPAVVLTHDSRTLELARYHEIPHRRLADVPTDVDPADLYAEADYTGFNSGHAARMANFVAFLERNGLPHVFTPATAAGAAAFDARVRSVRFPPPVVTRPAREAAVSPIRRALDRAQATVGKAVRRVRGD